MLARMGRSDEALAKAEILANATPDSGAVHHTIANLYIGQGDFRQALVHEEKEVFGFLRLQNEAVIYHFLGEYETAQQKLQELVDTYGIDASAQVAVVHAAWGNVDEALAALERGFGIKDPGLIYILGNRFIHPLLEGDPRYDDLLKRMKFL